VVAKRSLALAPSECWIVANSIVSSCSPWMMKAVMAGGAAAWVLDAHCSHASVTAASAVKR
jgi:hypothetical protein